MESVKESLSFGGQIWRRVYCKLENKEMKSENDIYPHDPLQHTGKKKKDTLAEVEVGIEDIRIDNSYQIRENCMFCQVKSNLQGNASSMVVF